MKIETVTIVETCSDPDPLEGDNSPGNKYTRVSINDKHGFRDRNGKMIIEPIYDQAGWFSEGLVTVQLGNQYGLIDENGVFAIPLRELEYLGSMHNGLAAFVDDGKYGFLEKTGQEKIKPQFDWASQFSEGLCAVRNDEGLYGYIDTSGILVIPCLFQRAYDFLRGKASIELNNTKGTIDKTGKLITPHDQNDVTS